MPQHDCGDLTECTHIRKEVIKSVLNEMLPALSINKISRVIPLLIFATLTTLFTLNAIKFNKTTAFTINTQIQDLNRQVVIDNGFRNMISTYINIRLNEYQNTASPMTTMTNSTSSHIYYIFQIRVRDSSKNNQEQNDLSLEAFVSIVENAFDEFAPNTEHMVVGTQIAAYDVWDNIFTILFVFSLLSLAILSTIYSLCYLHE